MSFLSSFFSSFSNSRAKNNPRIESLSNLPQFSRSIYLSSPDAYLMMLSVDGKLIYFNGRNNIDHLFDQDRDGTFDFRGRLFKLELKLKDGHRWVVFYGIETDDPIGLQMSMQGLHDSISLRVYQELLSQIPELMPYLDPRKLAAAPTSYVYTLWENKGKYMISNISGTDCCVISGSRIITGSHHQLLNLMNR